MDSGAVWTIFPDPQAGQTQTNSTPIRDAPTAPSSAWNVNNDDDIDDEYDGGTDNNTPRTSERSQPPKPQQDEPRKRQRIVRACDHCNAARTKCSDTRPCERCTKKGLPCSYNKPYAKSRYAAPPAPGVSLDPGSGNLTRRVDERGRELGAVGWTWVQKTRRKCDSCRIKHKRCSGQNPCDECFDRRQECIYTNSHQTPAYQAAVQQQQVNNPYQPVVQQQVISTLPVESLRYGVTGPEVRRKIPDLASLQLARLYANEETPPLVFLHRAWTKLARAYAPLNPTDQADLRMVELGRSKADQPFDKARPPRFPQRKTWFYLQENFFVGWTETFHFLHRFTLKAWLDIVQSNAAAGFELWRGIGHARASVVLMTIALGTFDKLQISPTTPHSHDDIDVANLQFGDQMFSLAAGLLNSSPPPPNLEAVQASLLQDIYLLCTSRYSQAWYSFGNTLRMITAMGLHRRRGGNRGLGRDVLRFPDYAKIQCERRTFWSAYIIDKQLSLMTGRPGYFNDDSIDQDLPDCINDEEMSREGPTPSTGNDCYLDALVAHAQLNKLIVSIMREVYTLRDIPEEDRLLSAQRLHKELDDWNESLPFALRHLRPTVLNLLYRRQATLLRLAHCHAQILVCRPFLLAKYPTEPEEAEKKLVHDHRIRDCVEAARVALGFVLGLSARGENPQYQTLWYAQYVAYISATVLFVLPIAREREKTGFGRYHGHKETDAKLMQRVDQLIKAFVEQTHPFSLCRRWAVILEEMRTEAPKQQQDGGSAPAATTGAEVVEIEDDSSEYDEDENENDDSQVDQALEDALRAEWEAGEAANSQLTGENTNTNETGPPPAPPLSGQQPPSSAPAPSSGPAKPPTLWESKWKSTDWLDLDSAAFGPIQDFVWL
ncbi:fungal-specific transcription factor domain-containing protein [Apodospora peruviana]|uniref:Fungal-specific transcription factor domain-containing protein n=1 Tax=Apodospora peruviana TaxID=516989 RepID=A0AAE0HZR9_9PEZI|nr:fungal-specific transcription factor domain-containing protein [Apodospora peruviana]